MDQATLKTIIEAALLAADEPLDMEHILRMFSAEDSPPRDDIRAALGALQEECSGRGVELREVGSGFRYQTRAAVMPWVSRLWEERPPRYSRALLETLALIAYRQPVTRGEIEAIRGVSLSTNIVKTLLEREWIRVVGHRDVPGKPAMYGTTRQFLDYFNLTSLAELPTLAEIRDIDGINTELELGLLPEQVAADFESRSDEPVVADDEPGASAATGAEHAEPGSDGADYDNASSVESAVPGDSGPEQ